MAVRSQDSFRLILLAIAGSMLLVFSIAALKAAPAHYDDVTAENGQLLVSAIKG